jgi:hypothetical protein
METLRRLISQLKAETKRARAKLESGNEETTKQAKYVIVKNGELIIKLEKARREIKECLV